MSRRSARAEVVLTCRGCGTRTPVASIWIDDDGDPVITTTSDRLDQVRYSFVRELGTVIACPDVPQKVTVFCGRGHELQVNLPPLLAELTVMPTRRVRRAV
jgi:hypothetical protein